jgi:hypothetical protein
MTSFAYFQQSPTAANSQWHRIRLTVSFAVLTYTPCDGCAKSCLVLPDSLYGCRVPIKVCDAIHRIFCPRATEERMPVYITLMGVPSNKQGEEGGNKKKKVGKIPVNNISYIPIKGQVAVLKPIIDKISITYIIGDPDLEAVVVQSLLQEIEDGGHWQSGAFKIGSVAYQASAKLMIPSSSHTVLVQAGPKKKTTTHALRLEFNPAVLGAPGIAFLKTQLEALVLDGLSFTDIIVNGKVTRVDIAVDIVGVHLADLLILVNSGGKQHWYLSEEGKPETGYLGMKKSDQNAKWKTYNKRKQAKDQSKAPVEQAYGGLSHTRIEYTYTTNKSFLDLATLDNRFTEISLAYPKAPKGVKPYAWAFFIDSCSMRGQPAALAILPDGKLRKSYQKALDAAHASFWRPDKIWETWPNAISDSGLLPA